MKTSEQIGTLAEALAKAQAQFPAITRNREVEVRSDKGNYKFEYATLDHVLELVRQPCAAQGDRVMVAGKLIQRETDGGLWTTGLLVTSVVPIQEERGVDMAVTAQ